MRNLRNVKRAAFRFDDAESSDLTATAWDPTDDSLILAFGPNATSPVITLKRLSQCSHNINQAKVITSWDAHPPNPDLEFDQIIDLHCFPDSGTICLILLGGDIVVVHEDVQADEDQIEIVGSVDAGISAAAWSPDEELLSLATKADTFLYMTREFDGLANVSLTAEDVKVSNHVSVGWGKKETQFQGRGAKALRDPTIPEHVDEGVLSGLDSRGCTISWRGDGQYVALNSVMDHGGQTRRIVRIYSREGVLTSVSEAVDGMESALSWKPSGQLIASSKRKSDALEVIFFERNGLRHGEFSLRLGREEMETIGTSVQLKWNTDSSVLAVILTDRVLLWTSGNYHWYLKQEILLPPCRRARTPLELKWHPEKPLHLFINGGRNLDILQYTFCVARGSVSPPGDSGIVGVIDGKQLKVTPLRKANIPPPMALWTIDLPANAIDVCFVAVDAGFKAVVLHSTSVTELSKENKGKGDKFSWQMMYPKDYTEEWATVVPRMLSVWAGGSGAVLCSLANESKSLIMKLQSNQSITLETQVQHLVQSHDHHKAFCVDERGQVNGIDTSQSSRFHILELPALRYAHVEVWQDGNGRRLGFGLTTGGTLHVAGDQQMKIDGVTSFIVTDLHLIYTTSQHLLKLVHLNGASSLQVPLDEPEKDERCRALERGARIVTVMPSAYSLVLQMPRGNLETIFPRALVLAGVREDIRNKDYRKAFMSCRTHKVDMNLLYDYDPRQFMAETPLIVKQLAKVEFVDLLLSSLSEEDVSQTIYKETLQRNPTQGVDPTNGRIEGNPTYLDDGTRTSKVNKICEAILQILQRQPDAYLQSMITAHVCKSPPDLRAGLQIVSQLRKERQQEQAEQAVEHICFLADVNELYDTALGLYDLELTLLVAQQSQKDPREYLPYLQNLQKRTEHRRRFEIDNDLKRHGKALGHLHAANEYDDLKSYMVTHSLYDQALELFRHDQMRFAEVMTLFGEYLLDRNRYQDAGMAYEYVGRYAAAYEAYKAANMWRESLACAALVPLAESELDGLASDLADSLEESKDFAAVATIRIEYLHDVESALRALCKGNQFDEAIRVAASRDRADLIPQIVDPGLVEASATMTETFAEMKSQLHAQVPRLRELRQKKAEDPMAFLDGADGGEGDIPDNLSLAPTDVTTSAGTFMTRYTNRTTGTLATNATRKTSKNRRREERKRARGKKGTVYEEEYLVNSISRLIERLDSVSEDVKQLVRGLMRRAMRQRAVAVDTAMKEVYEACRQCMTEVFGAQTGTEHSGIGTTAQMEHQAKPVGGEGVLWEALHASGTKRERPQLRPLESLVLLGGLNGTASS